MYTATMIRVCRGRKFTFVFKLIVLLMFSNLAEISGRVSSYEVYEEGWGSGTIEYTTIWIWISALSNAVRDSAFNVAHWMFAFEYYCISRYMPFIFMKITPDAGMVRCDELVNKVLIFVNVLVPVVNGALLLKYNLCDIKFESPNQQTSKHCHFWSIF